MDVYATALLEAGAYVHDRQQCTMLRVGRATGTAMALLAWDRLRDGAHARARPVIALKLIPASVPICAAARQPTRCPTAPDLLR